MSCPCWSQYAGLARTGTSRARGQVAEMSYITPWGRRASTPRTFLLLVTTTKGIKIVPIVVCRRRAAAGLCNCASQHRLDLPGMVGLLRGCGSPGHSPRWGRVAAVPGGEEGCPSHSPDAQLDSPKPQSGAAAPCCSTARSSQLHPLPAACSENRWLHLHRPSLPFPGAAQLLQPLLPTLQPRPVCQLSSHALQFPCLLLNWKAQSWTGAASPTPRRGDTHSPLCLAPHRDILPLTLVCRTGRLRKERAWTTLQQPAWHRLELGGLDPQLCQGNLSSPCELSTCLILQLVWHRALPIGLHIAFQYHSPIKCFSKIWILLVFYGLNTGPSAPAGAGLWRDAWLQSKWVREAALADTSQSSELHACERSCPTLCFPCRQNQKSLADAAQHRRVQPTQVFVVLDVPLCLNLTTNPPVSVGLGGSQAKVLKRVQSRLA